MGAGSLAFAVGVYRPWTPLWVLVAVRDLRTRPNRCRVFAPDAVRGYPPGLHPSPSIKPTWRPGPRSYWRARRVPSDLRSLPHDSPAPSRRLAPVHAATAVAGLALTIWTALAFRRDAAKTGLVQRGLIAIYWTWIVVLGIHSRRSALTLADGYSIRGRRYEFPYWLKKARCARPASSAAAGVLAALRGRSTSVRQQQDSQTLINNGR